MPWEWLTREGCGMVDARIPQYRDATLEMARGRFNVRVPVVPPDEVGMLGEAILELGTALERKFSEVRQMLRVTEQVNTGVMLDEVLTHIYASFRTLLPYDRIGCSLLEDGGRTLRAVWSRTDSESPGIPVGYAAPMEGSSLQEILDTGRPRVLNDLAAYLADHPKSDATRRVVEEGIRSSLTCPLVATGKPVGFMFFSSRTVGCYADAHVDLFCQLAGHVATIIEKARLYEQLLDAQRHLEAANRVLDRLASIDGLTGLPNRRYFDEHVERERRRMQRVGRTLALVMIDIDHFKPYNDTYGHLQGDDCLKRIASVIRDNLQRASDFVARYGGEELAVVVSDVEGDDALRAAEMLRARVEALALPHASGVGGLVTISAGVTAAVPTHGMTVDWLIRSADRALYQAKREGRNRVVSAAAMPA